MDSKRLLLIEARPQPRALLSRSFENEGFIVTGATGIAEAALRMNPAPDLVVSSFAVSQGDPLDFCRTLKSDATAGDRSRSIPFLYLYDRRRPLSVNRLRDAQVEHAVGTPTFVRDVVLAGRLLAEAKEATRPSFTGALEAYALPTLLRVGSQPDRSSLVSLFSRGDEGVLTLRDGFIVGAESKNARTTLPGLRAFDRIAQWIDGGFAIEILPERADGKVLLALSVALQRIATTRAAFANALGDDQIDWVYEADYRAIGAQMDDIPRLAVDVAKLMDGKRTVYEILAESRTDEPTTLRIIRRLAERGIATRVEAPADALPIEVGPQIGREAEAPLPDWDEAPATIIAPTPTLFDPEVDAPRDFPKPVVTNLTSPAAARPIVPRTPRAPSTEPSERRSERREKSPWSNAALIPFGDERTGTKRSPVASIHERGQKSSAGKSETAAPFSEGAFSSDEEAFFINELSTPKLEAVGTWPGVERALVPIPAPTDVAAAEVKPKAKQATRPSGPDFSAGRATQPNVAKSRTQPNQTARPAEPKRKSADAARRAASRPFASIGVTTQTNLRTHTSRRRPAVSLAHRRRFPRVAAAGAVVIGIGLLVYGIVAPPSDRAEAGTARVFVGSERIEQRPTTPRDTIPTPPEEARAAGAQPTAADAPVEATAPRADETTVARAESATPAEADARRDDPAGAARTETPAARNDGTHDAATQLRRAERLLGQGRTDTAVRALRVVLSLDPEHARARVLLARTLYDQGLVPEAEGHVKKGLAVAPRNAELTLLSGVIAQSKGNRAAATSKFERYLKLSPKGRHADDVRKILEGWTR
ncbi:MAG: tetratricopeptide repeat protein [Deltaproteobacteria bacterium]|nr:tetratricopeptide repeat protein [Deltaproteobacteria bacterium]